MMSSRLTLRGIAVACLVAIAALVGADSLLFRTGYASILEPDSSTGLFELILNRERDAQRQNGDNMVVTLGDSRFGYLPKLACELTPETGYVIRSAGVAGSDARTWYYMLRDLDPTAGRYRAIVFGVDDYDDEDGPEDVNDDLRALHYLIARLRWRDVLEFAGSFNSMTARWGAFRGAVLKGLVYQNDLHAFLSHPQKRLDYVRLCRRGFESWTWDYQESPRSLEGLEVDWRTWTARMPAGCDAGLRAAVERFLLYRPSPQTGSVAQFRRRWFGKIVERYLGSRTKIIFMRLPRGPVLRPPELHVARRGVIRDLATQPNVILADEHAYDSLEHPNLFKDALHLNREGVVRFSAMLAREVRQALGPVQ
jgi:hypothetical protein